MNTQSDPTKWPCLFSSFSCWPPFFARSFFSRAFRAARRAARSWRATRWEWNWSISVNASDTNDIHPDQKKTPFFIPFIPEKGIFPYKQFGYYSPVEHKLNSGFTSPLILATIHAETPITKCWFRFNFRCRWPTNILFFFKPLMFAVDDFKLNQNDKWSLCQLNQIKSATKIRRFLDLLFFEGNPVVGHLLLELAHGLAQHRTRKVDLQNCWETHFLYPIWIQFDIYDEVSNGFYKVLSPRIRKRSWDSWDDPKSQLSVFVPPILRFQPALRSWWWSRNHKLKLAWNDPSFKHQRLRILETWNKACNNNNIFVFFWSKREYFWILILISWKSMKT